MNNEWEELKTMSDVAVAQAAGMKIEVEISGIWWVWDGHVWHSSAKYRARPRKPELQECKTADSPWLVCKHCYALGRCDIDKQARKKMKSLCWRHPCGTLLWNGEGADYSRSDYVRFPAGDIEGEVKA